MFQVLKLRIIPFTALTFEKEKEDVGVRALLVVLDHHVHRFGRIVDKLLAIYRQDVVGKVFVENILPKGYGCRFAKCRIARPEVAAVKFRVGDQSVRLGEGRRRAICNAIPIEDDSGKLLFKGVSQEMYFERQVLMN